MGENKCSQPEFILSLFLMKHKDVLEDALGLDIDQIELEKNHGSNDVDIYGICPSRRLELFVECQVKPSDPRHLNGNMINMLNGMQEGIVVWIASSFRSDFLEKIKLFLGSGRNKRKYINFYALEIHPEALTAIHFLNSMSKLTVWDNLHQVKDVCEFSPPLRLIFKHEQIHSTHLGKAAVRSPQLDLSNATDVKEYVIQELRSFIPELLNVHREKKCNQSDRIITIGAGKSGFTYRVSAKDRWNKAFVELFLDANQEPFYRLIKHYKEDLQRCIDENIQISRRRIGVYFKPDEDLDKTVLMIVTILKRFYQYFSPYLHGDASVGKGYVLHVGR